MTGGKFKLSVVLFLYAAAGQALAATSGFPGDSSLQRDASLLYDWTFRSSQVVLFPDVSFTCPQGRITNLTFVARSRPQRVSRNQDPELQVWYTNVDGTSHLRRGNGVALTTSNNNIGPNVYFVSPDELSFEMGDVLGLYHPLFRSSRANIYVQLGGGSLNFGQRSDNPIDMFLSTDRIEIRNDYPLVEVITDPPGCVQGSLTLKSLEDIVKAQQVVTYESEQRLISDIYLTCNATITKCTVAGLVQESGKSHPEVQLWRFRSQDSESGEITYDRVESFPLIGSDLQERSGERNVFDYTLSTVVHGTSGDVLGIYHPPADESSFTIHYYMVDTGPFNFARSGSSQTSFVANSSSARGYIYPLVQFDVSPANCASGFIEAEVMREQALYISNIVDVYSQERVIPDLRITESGQLTSWTFAANNNGIPERTQYTELRILRWDPENNEYETIHKTDSTVEPVRTGFLNVYKYVEDPPLRVEAGDVFGFYQPPEAESRLSLAVVAGAGPPNEVTMTTRSVKRQAGQNNDLPLVSIAIVIPTTAVPPPGQPDSGSNPTSSIVGGVVGVLLAVVGVVVVMMVVVFVMVTRRRKRRSKRVVERRGNLDQSMDNPVYAGTQSQQKFHPGEYEIPASATLPTPYQFDKFGESNVYALPDDTLHSGSKQVANPGYEASGDNHYYSAPDTSLSRSGQPSSSLGNYEIGIYVPTKTQRRAVSSAAGKSVYTTLEEVQHSFGQESALSFFTESEIYWTPASDEDELYQQLASKKYREIPRPLIQTGHHLGAGQFGTVYQGVWQSPSGSRDVAVKTLQKAAPESQVKFLQEAAIMGQFSHPNVVKLHGVVTVGEPVMIILELLKSGDMRDFLIRQQPEPGVMVTSDKPRMLLCFCEDICSGMQYLSRKAFVHRDLAARNILLSQDKTCKIGDFGLSRDLEDESYYVSHGGQVPVKWTAPEALHYKKYSTASDVWSFGAVMYEIWSLGHKPFKGYTNAQAIKMIDSGFRLAPPPGCPKEIYKLMIACWHPDKSSRPSFTQLLQELSQPEADLLLWSEEDRSVHSQASVLGAPLEAAKELYPRLQHRYKA